MGDFERSRAAQLIRESTHNGHLDLRELRNRTNDMAREIATHDAHYADAVRDGGAGHLNNIWVDRLTVGTREVLGIIPPSQWSHGGGDLMTAAGGWLVHRVIPERSFDTGGLACSLTSGQPITSVDPSRPLAAQGFHCEVPGGSRRR